MVKLMYSWRSRASAPVLLFFLLPSLSHAGAGIAPGDLPPGAITAIRVDDQAEGQGRGITIGVPLAEGTVSENEGLILTTTDGEVLPSQWNRLASWRTDGSTLHGALTFVTVDGGNSDGVYYISKGAPVQGASVSVADIVASGFDASVEVNLPRGTYRLSAQDLLIGAVEPSRLYTHFAGPLAAEFATGGHLRLSENGEAHTALQAHFFIRAYGRPVERVYVTVVLENTGGVTALTDIEATNVNVAVGGRTVEGFPKTNFTVFSDVRYPVRAWWNGDPNLWVQHDLDYVASTKLMQWYRNIAKDEQVLASYPQAAEWNRRVILSEAHLESGGSKPEISPVDEWTASYIVSGDRRAWNAMRAAADEYSQLVYNLSGGVVHARDEETGFPFDLSVKGVRGAIWDSGFTSPLTLRASRSGLAVAQADISHWPSIGYLPYLLTAESNELENVQHSGIGVWLNEGPGGTIGTIPNERTFRVPIQPRAVGWSLREVVNAAVATPDHHPLRSALQDAVSFYLAGMDDLVGGSSSANPLGIWTPRSYIGNDELGPDTGYKVWQDDYITWAVGIAYERGWKAELDASGLWHWKAKGVVGRFGLTAGSGSYCWAYAARYTLAARPSSTSSEFNSWSDLFEANFSDVDTCPPPGTATMTSDGNPTTYGAQIAPALAVAVDTGVPGAQEAWEVYESRQKSWHFERQSAWAVVPRDLVRPSPPGSVTVN